MLKTEETLLKILEMGVGITPCSTLRKPSGNCQSIGSENYMYSMSQVFQKFISKSKFETPYCGYLRSTKTHVKYMVLQGFSVQISACIENIYVYSNDRCKKSMPSHTHTHIYTATTFVLFSTRMQSVIIHYVDSFVSVLNHSH